MDLLQELVFKSLAIKNLMKRNKEKLELVQETKKPSSSAKPKQLEQNSESQNSNPQFNPKKDDVIQFPFIVVLSSSSENSVFKFGNDIIFR